MVLIIYINFSQVDADLNKELEQWNELIKNEAVKLCQENNFNSGFFEGSESNSVVDAYELKVIYPNFFLASFHFII